MKKLIIVLGVLTMCMAGMILLSGCAGRYTPPLFDDTLPPVEPDPDVHVRVTAAGEPNIIYAPLSNRAGYRYGPSIMYYADGSCDAWFSANGNFGEWDWVTVRHSTDGVEFTDERSALSPHPDSYDNFSCCDPGAIYFGGYYYVGYTSTIESTGGGVNNNVFVARSERPEGPYEKWNGKGWGGDPAPVIYYDEYDLKYGSGEPSFVVVDDVLYMYYTWACPEGNYAKVSTSDTAEDWPARLEYRGIAYTKAAQDSIDVAYLEDAGKFIAFATQNRFSENSGIAVLESEDGLSFQQTDFICEGLYQYCHNMGIARRPDGHIQLKDNVFVGYAFSDGESGNWGKWATAFQPVKLELYRGEVTPSPASKSILCVDYFTDPELDRPMIAIASSDRILELYSLDDKHSVNIVWLDSFLDTHAIEDTKNLRFYGYDKSLITIKGTMIYSRGVSGVTMVSVSYKGYYARFKVFVHDDYPEFRDNFTKTVVSFTPVCDKFELSVSERHHPQIRGLVRFSDSTWGEAFNDGEMININKFPVTYDVLDERIAMVNTRGIIYPVSPGTTRVKVTVAGEMSFYVTITIF